MTNTIVVESASSPFEFLKSWLDDLDDYGNHENSFSVSTYGDEERTRDGYRFCLPCSKCGPNAEMIVLKFSKEFDDRLISFYEHTCTKCTERQYSV